MKQISVESTFVGQHKLLVPAKGLLKDNVDCTRFRFSKPLE